jgi:hypothetical protein
MRLVGADVSADSSSLPIASRGPRSLQAPMRGYNVIGCQRLLCNTYTFIEFLIN